MKFKISRINFPHFKCGEIVEADTKEEAIKIADRIFDKNGDVVEITNIETGESEIIEKTLLLGSISFMNTRRVKEMRIMMREKSPGNTAMKKRHMARIAAYMLVFVDDKLLLMKHKKEGYGDKKYTVPSGHIENNESPLECAIRETKEEIDIVVDETKFLCVLYRKDKTIRENYSNDDYVDFFFLCKSFTGTPKVNEPDKCYELIYADPYDLPQNMWEHVELAITNIYGVGSLMMDVKMEQ